MRWFNSLLVACLAGLAPVPAWAADRVALVIGNSFYENTRPLLQPAEDASAVAEALRRHGFAVELAIDVDQRGLQRALSDFGFEAGVADLALIFFAGHGLQVAGRTWLLPIDARLRRERDLVYDAIPLDLMLEEAGEAQGAGAVLVDAAYANPLVDQVAAAVPPERASAVGVGLAAPEALPEDTALVLAAAPGALAVEPESPNGVFSSQLVTLLDEPGLELRELFDRLRRGVAEATAGRQEPEVIANLGDAPVYIVPPNHPPAMAAVASLEVEDDAGAVPLGLPEPFDPDGDPLSVQVRDLPGAGRIELGGRMLGPGDVLPAASLADLRFVPERGRTGDAGALRLRIVDGRGGTVETALEIKVVAGNRAPVVATRRTLRMPDIPLGIEPPVDPDGDPLTIRVAALPELGRIKDGGRALQVGENLSPEQLAGLVLEPTAAGARGEFAFEVTDSRGATVVSRLAVDMPGLGGGPGVAASTLPPAGSAAPPSSPEGAPAPAPAAATPEPDVAAGQGSIAGSGLSELSLYRTLRMSNLRAGPDVDSDRVATVPPETLLKVTGKADGQTWLAVETEDGTRGYIYFALVRPVTLAASEASIAEREAADAAEALEPGGSSGANGAGPAATRAAPEADAAEDAGFADCERCPLLVAIPGGRFTMGTDDGHPREGPAHEVAVEPFALGKYEVTVAEWRACERADACARQPHLLGLPGRTPAHELSFEDARDYVDWLKGVTGQPYRLPSEAEWEYAARAGTRTAYWWGADVGEGRANCAGCGEPWDRDRPAQAGTFGANPFGVHDVHGGVMEWVADCWFETHEGAPADARPREREGCTERVLRGGSWRNDGSYATATSRIGYDQATRYLTNGFRVARDLDQP